MKWAFFKLLDDIFCRYISDNTLDVTKENKTKMIWGFEISIFCLIISFILQMNHGGAIEIMMHEFIQLLGLKTNFAIYYKLQIWSQNAKCNQNFDLQRLSKSQLVKENEVLSFVRNNRFHLRFNWFIFV